MRDLVVGLATGLTAGFTVHWVTLSWTSWDGWQRWLTTVGVAGVVLIGVFASLRAIGRRRHTSGISVGTKLRAESDACVEDVHIQPPKNADPIEVATDIRAKGDVGIQGIHIGKKGRPGNG